MVGVSKSAKKTVRSKSKKIEPLKSLKKEVQEATVEKAMDQKQPSQSKYGNSAIDISVGEGAHPGYLSNDEVLDDIEKAQILNLQEIASLTRRVQELNRPQTHPDFDGIHCLECDVDLPELRLKNGYILCVDCKTLEEEDEKRRKNLYG